MVPLLRTIILSLNNKIETSNYNEKREVLTKIREKFKKVFDSVIAGTSVNTGINSPGLTGGITLDVEKIKDSYRSDGYFMKGDERIYFHKHISEHLEEAFRNIRYGEKTKQKDKVKNDFRIVIFVDDLDRCTPDRALELLESIKTFFDIEGIIYVIGIDPKTIDPIIETKYGQDKKIAGMDYLQKIVQLPFQIPVWGTKEIAETVKTMIERTGITDPNIREILAEKSTSVEMIMRAAQLNPRDVKRFVNTIILSSYVYRQSISDIEKLIAIQAFYFRGSKWIEFLNLLVPFWRRTDFLKYFIMILKIHEYKSEISSLKDLNKIINDGIKEFDLQKSTLNIFKKLISLGDDELFYFLTIASKTLIKIDEMNKYLRIVETAALVDKSESYRDRDSEKLYPLLSNGEIIKFNELRTKQRGQLHLPYLDLPIDVKQQGKKLRMSGVKLNGVNLSRSFLFGAEMSYADLSDADLSDSDLSLAALRSANLSRANMKSTDLTDAYLWEANLSRAELQYSKLIRTDFNQANMKRANLYIARAEGAIFNYTKLVGADLRAILADASFSEADLTRANLFQANLVRARLDANLTGANLVEANLKEANLTYATLIEADLTDANLTRATLIEADLTDANLTRTNLTDAVLVNTVSFERLKVEGAKFDNALIDDPDLVDYLTDEKTAQSVPKCIESKSELEFKLKEKGFSNDISELILERTRLL
jgi:uncharacterized protein YjbI with pentapeptide repeats